MVRELSPSPLAHLRAHERRSARARMHLRARMLRELSPSPLAHLHRHRRIHARHARAQALAKESCATVPAAPFCGAGLFGWRSRAIHCGARTCALRAVSRAVPPRKKARGFPRFLCPSSRGSCCRFQAFRCVPGACRSGPAKRNAMRRGMTARGFRVCRQRCSFPLFFTAGRSQLRAESDAAVREKKKTNR